MRVISGRAAPARRRPPRDGCGWRRRRTSPDPVDDRQFVVGQGREAQRLDVVVVSGQDRIATYGDSEGDQAQRYARTREFLQLTRRLWTEQNVTFHGDHFQVTDSTVAVRPAVRGDRRHPKPKPRSSRRPPERSPRTATSAPPPSASSASSTSRPAARSSTTTSTPRPAGSAAARPPRGCSAQLPKWPSRCADTRPSASPTSSSPTPLTYRRSKDREINCYPFSVRTSEVPPRPRDAGVPSRPQTRPPGHADARAVTPPVTAVREAPCRRTPR
nr:LLM class flavin-dependent oxidoreductase [Actinoplanes derwentensis]